MKNPLLLAIIFSIFSAAQAKVCYVVGHATCVRDNPGEVIHFSNVSGYKTNSYSCRPNGDDREFVRYISQHRLARIMREGCKYGTIRTTHHRYWTYTSNSEANGKIAQLFYGCKKDNKICIQLDGIFNPFNY